MKTFLEVCFKDQSGNWISSRSFATIRAARSWAKLISKHNYVAEVAIYRGGAGGERLDLPTSPLKCVIRCIRDAQSGGPTV